MPKGKGTYGSKRGRPKKSKMSTNKKSESFEDIMFGGMENLNKMVKKLKKSESKKFRR